jgi:ribose 1,5-bisphosphate isomerase
VDPETAARKIKSMEIRGALKIGTTAAEALASYAEKYRGNDFLRDFQKQAKLLKAARPTAVTLPNAVDYVLYLAKNNPQKDIPCLVSKFVKEQDEALENVAKIGAKRIRKGDTILTHCNSTAALGIIKEAKKKKISVVCTETRPRHQGYLTAAFMAKNKIPVTLIIDSAVRYAMEEFDIDKVVIGADTVTANGAVANKIGTSQIAAIAHEANIPVIVGCETLKFSPQTLDGTMIEVEQREHAEIRPEMRGVKMWNPAFDFTPPEYIDIIVTEDGIISPYMAYDIIKNKFAWRK